MGLPKALNKGIEEVPSLASDPIYDGLVVKFPLRYLENKKEHEAAKLMFLSLVRIKKLDALSKAQIASVNRYLNALKFFIKSFEDEYFKFDPISASDMLRELMERNGLKQSDFEKEIGKQPVVSKILSGNVALSAEQIGKLCKRFNISADAFFG
jgi:antitoxin component HigA of HigAB toxin-antitoxin module